MEKKLEKVMDDIVSSEGVTGCLFADQSGLCLGSKGNVSATSSGLIVALTDLVAKLEPNSQPPVITLESEDRSCLIQKNGKITGLILKTSNVTNVD